MVTAIAIARAKPGQEDELGRRMMALVAPTLAEPGCINYDLHRSNTDPAVWIFYENWQSQADLDAHMQSAHYRSFFSRADEVLAHEDAHFSVHDVGAWRLVPALLTATAVAACSSHNERLPSSEPHHQDTVIDQNCRLPAHRPAPL
jgi:quinol monooxygenase YgiN